MTLNVTSVPSIRTPWKPGGLTVYAHSFWRPENQDLAYRTRASESKTSIRIHPAHEAATKHGDADAAFRVVVDTVDRTALQNLGKSISRKSTPIFAVPYVPTEKNGRNALGIQYAHFLADYFSGEVAEGLFQTRRLGRGVMSHLERIILQPRFEGEIEQGGDHILVDDVCASGGAFAALRGYIESRGGNVAAATVLANGHGRLDTAGGEITPKNVAAKLSFNLAIGDNTLNQIQRNMGGSVAAIKNYLGFPAECLTSREGGILQEFGSSLQNVLPNTWARLSPARSRLA